MNVYPSSQKRNNEPPIRILPLCLIILFCITIAACGIKEKTPPSVNAAPVFEHQEIKEDSDRAGLTLAKKVPGVPENIKVWESGWVDLVGDGKYEEFILIYYSIGVLSRVLRKFSLSSKL
jgi:predicted small lipoprotein YifL